MAGSRPAPLTPDFESAITEAGSIQRALRTGARPRMILRGIAAGIRHQRGRADPVAVEFGEAVDGLSEHPLSRVTAVPLLVGGCVP